MGSSGHNSTNDDFGDERLATFCLDHASVCALTLNQDGHILYANRRAYESLGYSNGSNLKGCWVMRHRRHPDMRHSSTAASASGVPTSRKAIAALTDTAILGSASAAISGSTARKASFFTYDIVLLLKFFLQSPVVRTPKALVK